MHFAQVALGFAQLPSQFARIPRQLFPPSAKDTMDRSFHRRVPNQIPEVLFASVALLSGLIVKEFHLLCRLGLLIFPKSTAGANLQTTYIELRLRDVLGRRSSSR